MSEFEIVIPAKETAELRPSRVEQPQPGGPLKEDEVEGHTVVTVVSPGTELSWGFNGENVPVYPGYAAVFKVERTGSAVKDIQPGDLVFSMGAHRSFQKCPRNRVVPVPQGLDPAAAVLVRLMGVSLTTLVTTSARSPARVLVSGLGPVGNLAAQAFHACGYTVMGCDPVQWRRELLQSAGIPAFSSVPAENSEFANQVDLVVDCSGHEASVLDACKLVRRGGEVVLVGVPWRKRTEISAHALLHAVFHRYVVLRSGWEWELELDRINFRPGSIMENFRGGLDWLQQGRVRTTRLTDRASPRDAQQVYSDLAAQRKTVLTTVFDWSMV